MTFASIYLFVDSILLLHCLLCSLITKRQIGGGLVKGVVGSVVQCCGEHTLSGQNRKPRTLTPHHEGLLEAGRQLAKKKKEVQ